jgi:hypothetical protein
MTLDQASLFDDLEEETPTPPAEPAIPEPTGFEYGIKRSADSAAKWTAEQIRIVDHAILLTARREEEFTADDVWRNLPAGFPVTKGMAARLMAAARRGKIFSTGYYAKSNRGGAHDHGQRLTVWRRSGLVWSDR